MGRWDWHEFTAAGGTRMHAAGYGPRTAPPVVCVHGLGCSHRYFLPLARELAPQFQTLAVDLPGFGWTPGPPRSLDVREMSSALADWLRVTGRGGAPLVGDSTGCQSIVDLAVVGPELLGPVILDGPTFDRHRRRPLSQVGRLLANGVLDRTGLGMLPIRFRDRRDSGLRRWIATFLHCLPDPVERKIGKIKTPVVVIRGSRDPLVPQRWAEELVSLVPNGRLTVVPGTGHTVNFAAPEAVAAAVREAVAASAGTAGRSPAEPEATAVLTPQRGS